MVGSQESGCGDSPTSASPDPLGEDVLPLLATFDAGGVMSSVGGSGHFAVTTEAVNSSMFNAEEKADGPVKGQATMQVRLHDTFWKMDIDCLAVSGNQAVVSGVLSNPRYVGMGGWLAMEDNGEGRNAEPDRITGFYPILPDYLPVPGYCHKAIDDIDAYLEDWPVRWNTVIRWNVQVRGAGGL